MSCKQRSIPQKGDEGFSVTGDSECGVIYQLIRGDKRLAIGLDQAQLTRLKDRFGS